MPQPAYLVDAEQIDATLVRVLGDFDPAEEGVHQVFAAGSRLLHSERLSRHGES
jgi:predicted RNA polymerase sigma factor